MKRRIKATIGVLLLTPLLMLGFVPPASAATKTVTITVGDWNCRYNNQYKGSVSRALIAVVPGNNPSASWLDGRSRTVNVIYQSGGSRVGIKAQIFCKTSWFGTGYYRTINTGRWVNSSTPSNWDI